MPDNPYNVPLSGSIMVGFELDTEGKAVNPQVVRTTLPEANPAILTELLEWRFAISPRTPGQRMWGRLEVKLSIP